MYLKLKGFLKHFFVYIFITLLSLYTFFVKILHDDNILVSIPNERSIYKMDIQNNNFHDILKSRMTISLVKYFQLLPSNKLINENLKQNYTLFDKENKVDVELLKKNIKNQQQKFFESQKYELSINLLSNSFKLNNLQYKNSYINTIINQYLNNERHFKYIEIDYKADLQYSDYELESIYQTKVQSFIKKSHYKTKYIILDDKVYPIVQEDISLNISFEDLVKKYNASVILEEDIESNDKILLNQIQLNEANNNNKLKISFYYDFIEERLQSFEEAKQVIIENDLLPELLNNAVENIKLFTHKSYFDFINNVQKNNYHIYDMIYKNSKDLETNQLIRDNKEKLLNLNLNNSSDFILYNNKLYVFILYDLKVNTNNNTLYYSPNLIDPLLDFMIKELKVTIY